MEQVADTGDLCGGAAVPSRAPLERMDVGSSSVKVCVTCVSVALGLEQPDYDLDSGDEVLLRRLNKETQVKPEQFETMMDRLEKASTQRVRTHS